MTFSPFQFVFDGATLLQQLTPVNASYETGAFTGSGIGDVTASVTAVDINLTPPRASTSGCEAADFAGVRPRGAEANRAHPAGHLHIRGQGA